jgi:RNA polymerase sigma factor (sigma-70 family)
MAMNSTTRTLDELLQHERFVQRLARSLLGTDSDADDLVQETWLRAVQHPPDSRGQARGWLGTVVRNLARDWRVGESNRERREAAAARAEATLPLQQLLEREETRKKIVQALGQLSPEQASAIVLRFFDGLPPREIAVRLSVPVETIKKRLGRGVAELRELLDSAFEGGRNGWMAALPAVVNSSGVATSTVATATTSAATISSTTAKVVGVMLLVGLSSMLVMTGAFRGDRPQKGDLRPGREAEVAAPARPQDGVVSLRPARAKAEADKAVPKTVRGRVLDLNRQPVNHADVRVLLQTPYDQPLYVPATSFDRSVRTGVDGRFEMGVLPHGKYLVLADAPGLALVARPWVNPGDEVDLVAEPPANIDGMVARRDTGAPVAGATLCVYLSVLRTQPVRKVTSTATGAFSVTGLPSGRISLSTTLDGFLSQQDDLALDAGSKTRHDVTLDPGATIVGHVREAESNRPIEGVQVSTPVRTVLTDASGAFDLTGLEAGECQLTAGGRGWLRNSLRVQVIERRTSEDIGILLTKGESTSGIVLDAVTKKPIEGVAVDSDDATTKTDKEGRFELVGRPDDNLILKFRRHGYSGRMQLWRLHQRFTKASTIELTPADLRIAGHVRDRLGVPLSDVRVECRMTGGGGEMFDEVTGTDANGGFEFNGCERDTSFDVMAMTPGFAESFVRIDQSGAGAGDIELVLEPNPVIEGNVVDERSRAIVGAKIRLSGSGVVYGITSALLTTSDSDGRFRIASPFNPKSGRLRLLASAESFAQEEVEIQATSGSYVISLYRVGRIRGQLIDAATQEPVRDGKIEIAPSASSQPAAWTRAARYSGRTSETGHFEFEAPAGAHSVIPKVAGYATVDPDAVTVEVVPGNTIDAGVIRLVPAGRFEGTIRRGGQPAAVQILIQDSKTGTTKVVARSDDSGWYRSDWITLGTYDVVAVPQGAPDEGSEGTPGVAPCWPIGTIVLKQQAPETLDAALPAPATLTLSMSGDAEEPRGTSESTEWVASCGGARGGKAHVIVKSSDGRAIIGCGVPRSALSSVVDLKVSGLTAGKGVTLELPACACKLVFEAPGFQTIETSVTLTSGETSRVDLKLKRVADQRDAK